MPNDNSSDMPPPKASEPDEIKEIRLNIKAGEEWLKSGRYCTQNTRERFWKTNEELLRCDWNGVKLREPNEATEFHVNIPYQNYRTVIPTLVWQMPHVSVEAKQPEFERDEVTQDPMMTNEASGMPQMKSDNYVNARLMELALNHEIDQMKLKDIIRRCVGHSKGLYGIGWAKVGYETMSFAQPNNDRDSATNMWVDWVNPKNIVFDWMNVEAKRLNFTAQRCVLKKSKALEMGLKIPDGYVSKLPQEIIDREQQTYGNDIGSMYKDSPLELIEFWEYHNHEKNTIDWVLLDANGPENFFIQDKSVEPYPFEGSSFVPLVIDSDDGDLIGLTDIQPVYDQVKALNRMRTREVHHMDNYGTGIIEEEGAVPVEEKKRYDKTPYGFRLQVRTGKIGAVKIVGTPSMGSDHYNMSNVHKEEIRTILRITDYQQGGGDLSRKATEAQLINSGSSLSIEDSRSIVGDFAVEIVRRISAMKQKFGKPIDFINVAHDQFDDQFINVLEQQVGYNPKLGFIGVPKERIQGEFDFKINIDEMIHQPKEVRAAQLQKSLGLLLQDPIEYQKFKEKYDTDKIWEDIFALNGCDLQKYEKGGPVQITAVLENEMFRRGMEVPEPNVKDDPSEHIIVHSQILKELQDQLQAMSGKLQQLQQGVQMIPQMMGNSPQAGTVVQTAQSKIGELTSQLVAINEKLRNVKLHMQMHQAKEMEKEAAAGGGGGGMPQGMAQGQQVTQPPQPEDIQAMGRPPTQGQF